jgi:hypothetical protein
LGASRMKIMETYKADQVRALVAAKALKKVVVMEMETGHFTLTFFPKGQDCLAYNYEADRGETRYFKTVNAAWVMAKKLGINTIEVSK